MNQPFVKLTKDNEVAYIEFFHPKHNSLPSNLLHDIEQAIKEAGDNPTIKVIVLQSGGNRAFCSGASFEEMISIDNEEEGKSFFSGFANVINAMRTCPKLIIGRIQGKAVGGGVGIIACTDYCLATKHAAIKLSELNIGIGPFVISPAIERKIGLIAMSEITIKSNTFFSAEWARQKGLFSEVYEDNEELDIAVKAIAELVCTYNPESVREIKNIFWKGTEHWDTLLAERAQITGRLVLSDVTKKKLESLQIK